MMYHNPQAVVQVNVRRLRAFAIERSVRQGCHLSPLLYVLALEPLLRRLRDEGTNLALRGVPFAGPLTARVSAFGDDITFFVSHRKDIKAVKKAVGEYERIAGAKINFDKSEGLLLGAWRISDTLTGPFRWSDGTDLQLERNWSEVQAKGNAQVAIWLSRRFSVYVFPLKLYRLAVLPLPKARRLALQRPLSRLLWGGSRPMVRRQVRIQRTNNGGQGQTFLRLKSDPKAEGRRKPLCEALFVRERQTALRNLLGSSDLSRPRKELYRNHNNKETNKYLIQ